jgi:uncharacterized protein (DUF2062 family)
MWGATELRVPSMLRRPIIHYLRRLLALNDTPERIAFAFALGVFLAFSPLLGLHTFLGLAIAFLFGLNRAAILVGLFINNPWTLVPIYGAASYLGGLLMGYPALDSLPELGWGQIFRGEFWQQVVQQWPVFIHVALGSAVLASIAAILSYLLALYFVRQRKWRGQLPVVSGQ